MLKGFNYPLTPKGKSTLNPPPPWHYSADFLNIEFWSNPSAVTALLPPGLDPDPSARGHCNALFYDWQFSGENEEYLDPHRYQYREFFILVDALFKGRPVCYCPYIGAKFVFRSGAIGTVRCRSDVDAAMRERAQSIGARLAIESRKNGGTSVRICVPLAKIKKPVKPNTQS